VSFLIFSIEYFGNMLIRKQYYGLMEMVSKTISFF